MKTTEPEPFDTVHLGTTRELIAKLLRRMIAVKLVKTLRGAIVVEKPDALAKLAGHKVIPEFV